MKVKCDICDIEFDLSGEKIKVKNVNGIEVTYFECNSCNHKYIISCYDDYVLREQNKLKKLDEKISAADSTVPFIIFFCVVSVPLSFFSQADRTNKEAAAKMKMAMIYIFLLIFALYSIILPRYSFMTSTFFTFISHIWICRIPCMARTKLYK